MKFSSAVSASVLVKLGVGVAVHGDAGLDAREEERGVVEAVFRSEGKLLSWSLGRQLCVSGDGAEVWHDAQDALGLLGTVGADGVGVVGRLRGRCGRLAGLRILPGAGSVGKFGGGERRCEGGRFGWEACGGVGVELRVKSERSPEHGNRESGAKHQATPPELVSRTKGHTDKTRFSRNRLSSA